MTLGAGSLRNNGRQYLIVASAAQNNLSADVYESDDGTPTFTSNAKAWSVDVPNDKSPRALWNTPSRDVEIKVSTANTSGAAVYFRVESPTKMWRIAYGDVDPVVYALPYWNWRWGWWWGDYFGYYRIRYGRRWLYRYRGYIPATPGFCVKQAPYVSFSQANQCVCTTSSSGYTVYKSNKEPDYDFEHTFALNRQCGGSYCSNRSRRGCKRGCITSTKITPYYCVGGTPAQYIPRYQENVSVPRVFVQYRNGSLNWTTLFQQELKSQDVRIVADNTKIDLFFGSYDKDIWTFDSSFQDTVTSTEAFFHGIGGADVSEDFSAVDKGLRCLWIQSR